MRLGRALAAGGALLDIRAALEGYESAEQAFKVDQPPGSSGGAPGWAGGARGAALWWEDRRTFHSPALEAPGALPRLAGALGDAFAVLQEVDERSGSAPHAPLLEASLAAFLPAGALPAPRDADPQETVMADRTGMPPRGKVSSPARLEPSHLPAQAPHLCCRAQFALLHGAGQSMDDACCLGLHSGLKDSLFT